MFTDFARSMEAGFFEALLKDWERFRPTVLVNNVGTWQHKRFEEQTVEEVRRLMAINMVPQTILTNQFLALARSRTTRSAIINVSSLSIFASPKSAILTIASSCLATYRMFSGFKSR